MTSLRHHQLTSCERLIVSLRRRWPEGSARTSGLPESALQTRGGWDKLYLLAIQKRRRRAAMQQIADWLKTLGMSEYAERFAESDIDTSVLRDLND
jgi:SAM domain (Sterile alpha motif)